MNERQAEELLCAHMSSEGWPTARQFEIGGKRVDVVALAHGEWMGVEVKLRDWRKGASQAYLNQGYFSRSYLALPRGVEGGATEAVRELGVGLILFDIDRFDVVIEASRIDISEAVTARVTDRASAMSKASYGR